MHRYFYTFLAIPFLAIPLMALANVPLNRIVATVNDDVILQSELDTRIAMVTTQLEEQHARLPGAEALKKQVLERLIIENLELQTAAQSGIRIDDDTLNKNLLGMAKQNNMTLDQFRQVLEKDGFDFVAFREQFRNQLTMNRVRQQMVDNHVEVTEQEVNHLLTTAASFKDQNREYHLAHILVSVPEAASPEQLQAAQQRVDDIRQRLEDGADFAQVAIAESDGQQALTGGDLGWRKAAQLPSFFSDVVEQMTPGQISEPIRSPSGFHLIKIVAERGNERHIVVQTRVRHILLRPDALASEGDVRTRIQQLHDRIVQGEDFATLARANSQDPGSGSKGGDLGWVTPGQMVPEFEKAMDNLKVGEVSEPIMSPFGWHLILVEERRQQDNTEDFRRSQAREAIRQRKTEEEQEIWLRRLRDEAYVEYHLDDQ